MKALNTHLVGYQFCKGILMPPQSVSDCIQKSTFRINLRTIIVRGDI